MTKFQYDPNQNLIQITKPEGNIVEYDYDERNLRIATRVGRDCSLTPPEPGAVTVTAYDANGNVLQVIGPADRGGTTGHGHDRGRLPQRPDLDAYGRPGL